MKNKASCVLIVDKKSNLFLAVSLKDDHSDMNLPGGKVEKGETCMTAGIRETKEETGLRVWNLKLLHRDWDSSWEVYTYYTHCFEGEIQTEENHVVKWLPLEELTKSKKWPKYNTDVYHKYLQKSSVI